MNEIKTHIISFWRNIWRDLGEEANKMFIVSVFFVCKLEFLVKSLGIMFHKEF